MSRDIQINIYIDSYRFARNALRAKIYMECFYIKCLNEKFYAKQSAIRNAKIKKG